MHSVHAHVQSIDGLGNTQHTHCFNMEDQYVHLKYRYTEFRKTNKLTMYMHMLHSTRTVPSRYGGSKSCPPLLLHVRHSTLNMVRFIWTTHTTRAPRTPRTLIKPLRSSKLRISQFARCFWLFCVIGKEYKVSSRKFHVQYV